MADKEKKPGDAHSVYIKNRKAWHDYNIIEKVECGISLVGTEVKSIRAGQIRLDEAHARVRDGEVFLVGANISAYPQAAPGMQHNPTRERKLLVRKRQIKQLAEHVRQKGKTIVPLSLYFKRGWAKLSLGLAVGKQQHDKRESLKKRQQTREIDRDLSRRRR